MKYCFHLLAISFLLTTSCKTQSNSQVFSEKYRPQYHFSKKEGWMNDPTGMFFYAGRYHLNYHTGLTKDFIHWEHGTHNLREIDSMRVMSGSAVIDRKNTSAFGSEKKPAIVAVFSHLNQQTREQTQSVAFSLDTAKTWSMHKSNPVIDLNSKEFRDPHVFWHNSTNRWIMAVALADKCQVRFYSSLNLKEWAFESDFGPMGADFGVWECPDIFQLPVEGNQNQQKWILEVDVQPYGGQYFVGDFDGHQFKIDSGFKKSLLAQSSQQDYQPVFSFEEGISDWKKEGDAFNNNPAKGTLPNQNAVMGFKGNRLINSFQGGDQTTGRLLTPPFEITEDYLCFLIGGGNHPSKASINLLIDGKIKKTQPGVNSETLQWKSWNVKEIKGQKAQIEILDKVKAGWGHILVDEIVLSEKPVRTNMNVARWIDYGPDFYAVRSWPSTDETSPRKIWLAWMSNWLYAHDVPTDKWKGFQSIPRELTLHNKDGDYILKQNPILELKELRDQHTSKKKIVINKTDPLVLKPKRNTYELSLELDNSTDNNLFISIAEGDTTNLIVEVSPKDQLISVHRINNENHNFNSYFPGVYEAPLNSEGEKTTIQILVDQSSVEVFANEGVTCISTQFFPDENETRLRLFTRKGKMILDSLDLWQLQSVWSN